jgi:predicted phage baseplate assembly protein
LALLAGNAANVDAVRSSIGGGAGQQLLSVGFVPAIAVPGLYSDVGPPSAVTATWQMSQPPVVNQPVAYTTLKIVSDTTEGLTQNGVVRLLVPQTALIGAPANDVRADSQAGVGMKPPRIDDAAIAARLVTWVRLNVASACSVSWAGINAVDIDQRTTYTGIILGVSDGSGGQVFTLPAQQVDPASFELDVDMPGLGFQLWTATDDLAVLQGPSASFVLDPEAGTVTFGNQLQGMIPPLGRRVRIRSMRAGGGSAGNLPAGSLTSIQAFDASGNQVTQTMTVIQPIATSGGADAETLAAAQQRLPALLKHQGRAVTASDYKNLAEEVPGAAIGRVEVLPLFKPQTRTQDVPGVVSVMIIPDKNGVLNPCPRADRPLLETVYSYLSPRTPSTAEMYVIATDYVGLGLSVAVEVNSGYGLLQVSQAVETALRSYLWPLPPGGPASTGWPLGRSIRSLELEVEVSKVSGVIEINGLNLFSVLANGNYQQVTPDTSGKAELNLQSWQLPEVLEVVVIAGPDGSGVSAPVSLTPPVETDSSVAVPVVPNVC